MTTTEETPNIKELIKADLIKNKSFAKAKADMFGRKMKSLELEWRKFYQEICKYSSNFQLVDTSMSETFKVSVNTFNPDGTCNRYNGMICVDTIIVEYKDFEIVYTGKLPEGKSIPKVIVDEHITHNKSGYGITNHGFKMKTRINYNDSKFFKSGKKIVEMVNSFVEGEWNNVRRIKESLDLRNLAYKTMVDKYPNSKVSFSPKGEIVVTNENGCKISMGYYDRDGQVKYLLAKIEFPSDVNVDNLIEKLGSV